ncbi:MAG: hypothetical protein D6768_07225 [Chloroflexi bacterium]|nr:MAG: hypothetical protein D6768_07225 [Chloroflexota bacterium]
MDKYQQQKGKKLTALFFLGCLLFNYPVITLFSTDGLILGIPTLYIFIFVSWAALIALMAWVIEERT